MILILLYTDFMIKEGNSLILGIINERKVNGSKIYDCMFQE